MRGKRIKMGLPNAITDGQVIPSTWYNDVVNSLTNWPAQINANNQRLINLQMIAGYNDLLRIAPGGSVAITDGSGFIGFFGATPVGKPSALTVSASALGIAVTQTSPYGFSSSAEWTTVQSTINNLRTRIAELESKLQALGLVS